MQSDDWTPECSNIILHGAWLSEDVECVSWSEGSSDADGMNAGGRMLTVHADYDALTGHSSDGPALSRCGAHRPPQNIMIHYCDD